REQPTVNRSGDTAVITVKGRHDPTVLPRLVPVAEAMVLLVLADHWLRQRGARL
ncbi:MAG: chorismate synthase, partial [Chloroflexi bacterium]|nr:chorismate synthase [Chloroflexota bacterium]